MVFGRHALTIGVGWRSRALNACELWKVVKIVTEKVSQTLMKCTIPVFPWLPLIRDCLARSSSYSSVESVNVRIRCRNCSRLVVFRSYWGWRIRFLLWRSSLLCPDAPPLGVMAATSTFEALGGRFSTRGAWNMCLCAHTTYTCINRYGESYMLYVSLCICIYAKPCERYPGSTYSGSLMLSLGNTGDPRRTGTMPYSGSSGTKRSLR